MTPRPPDSGGEEPPGRAAARGPPGPEPVESADVQEAGLTEPHRAALSASLGVILGTVLAELGRRARARGCLHRR
jgi:hypothetical protein